MKIKYIIFACEKHRERKMSALDTWLRNVPKDDYMFIGDRSIPGHNQITYPGIPNNAEMNTRLCGRYFNDPKNFEDSYHWFAILDSDTYVFVPRLKRLLATLDYTRPLAVGHVTHSYPQEPQLAYLSGAGYYLSRTAMKLMFAVAKSAASQYNEYLDVWHGRMFKQAGIELIHDDRFRYSHPNIIRDTAEQRASAIQYHHLKSQSDFDLANAMDEA